MLAEEPVYEVAVVGGGLSGLAASIHLARFGFRVACFEPASDFSRLVGESLDWSAPELFSDLGLQMEDLVAQSVCTYKHNVALKTKHAGEINYIPSPWLAKPPLNIELRTLHVDRQQLHERLIAMTAALGVITIRDRVTGIERTGRRVIAVRTASGQTTFADWFVDASGAASSLFAREFHLRAEVYGPPKVAMWSYFKTSERPQGTRLYTDAAPGEYMEWIWEIPINPGTLSVGYVATGESIKHKRSKSLSVEDIYCRELMQYERFRNLMNSGEPVSAPNVTSFTCRVFKGVCGPNWVIIGEAASVPDPITGNGVTAALRHAQEATQLIARFRNKGRIPWLTRATYNLRVLHMGRFFNSLIEKLAYDKPVRDRIGLLKAGDIYTAAAWSINHLYSRFRPKSMLATAVWSSFLSALRSATWLFYWALGRMAERNGRSTKLVACGLEA